MWLSKPLGEFGRLEPLSDQRSVSQSKARETVVWRPDESLGDCVRSDMEIKLKQHTLTNDVRVLLGNFGDSMFLAQTMGLGIAIAEATGLLDSGELNACRLKFLLYQWVLRKRASFKKRFQSIEDFKIRDGYQTEGVHVLAHLRNMDGVFGSLREICELGCDGSDIERLRQGLNVLAEKHAFELSSKEQTETVVKNALFSVDEVEPCNDEALLEDVEKRLWHAVQDRLTCPTVEFNKWFWGKSANVEKRLSELRLFSDDQVLSRDLVKSALFEIGWRGHKLMGEMFELGMAEIFSRLPNTTELEKQMHGHLYARQRYLASLPLAMLLRYRRFPLEGFLGAIWEGRVDAQKTGALHTMLYFYSEMVTKRREVDRLAKRNRSFQILDSMGAPVTGYTKELEAIFDSIPSERRQACGECETSDIERSVSSSAKYLKITSACKQCGAVQPERKYLLDQVRDWVSE